MHPYQQNGGAPDLATWPTRHEAAAMLGWSIATLDRHIARHKFSTAARPRPGKKPEIVVNPADLSPYHQPPPAHPAMQAPAADYQTALSPTTAPAQFPAPQVSPELIALAAYVARAITPPPSPVQYLTVGEASELTGLSRAYLRRAIASGQLAAVRDGAHKVRIGDLSQL